MRARSWLLRFLAVLLVPVLVITATERPAAAGTTYGPTVSAEIEAGDSYVGLGLNCRVKARWQTVSGIGPGAVAPTSFVEWDASCSTGFDVASAHVEFSFEGDEGSSACDVMTGSNQYDGDPDHSGVTNSVSGTVVAGTPVASTCTIDDLCLEATVDLHSVPWGTNNYSECVPMLLGAPPAHQGDTGLTGCPVGPGLYPSAAPVVDLLVYNPSTGNSQVRITTSWNTAGVSPSNVTLRYWWGNPTAPSVTNAPTYATLGNGPNQQWQYTVTGDFSPGVNAEAQTLGVQVIASQPWSTAISPNGWAGGTSPPWTANTVRHPGMGDHIMGGVTMPTRCSWYFGTKIAEDPTTTVDNPAGELSGDWPPEDPPPPPVDECELDPTAEGCEPPGSTTDCGFSITDPSSWAGAGICQLVKLIARAVGVLGSILGVLQDVLAALANLGVDLATAIANAIAAGFELLGPLFEELFVPSPSSWGYAELQQTFNSRPPGSIVTAMGSSVGGFATAYSSASDGCVTLLDVEQSVSDLDTCDGRGPVFNGLYAFAQFAIVALTCLGCFKLVANHIGGKQ